MDDSSETEALSEQDRAALFRANAHGVDRAAALRAGSDKVPRRVIGWMVAGFLVLGVGGVLLEHYFSHSSLASSLPTTTLRGVGPTPSVPATPQLHGSLTSFVGLRRLTASSAPPIVLRDQHGRQWSLAAQRGHTVVLSFFDARCDDVCEFAREEMAVSQDALGSLSSKVEFVAINTDPFHTATSNEIAALSTPHPKGFLFLNGPLRTLNETWDNYGVTVTVGATRTQLAHNNIMYVIDPVGRLRFFVIPFANEDPSGRSWLASSQITRFGNGVAHLISNLGSR